MKNKYFIGIDGGATKTVGVLFDQDGNTLSSHVDLGSNLAIDEEKSTNLIVNLINTLVEKSKIKIDDIFSIGIGLAGASNERGRERLFGLLDNLNLSEKTIITNDVEAVYDYIWKEKDGGMLVNVGTGVICIGKKNNVFVKVAGNGHEEGDVGSGYWIGREALLELSYNDSNVESKDSKELLQRACSLYNVSSYEDILNDINSNDSAIPLIASFAKEVIAIAEKGDNQLAIRLIQHATRVVSDYIVELRDILGYGNQDIIIAGNGSILKNKFFRKELNNALSFEFNNIKWVFLDISAAYTAGLFSARLKSFKIDRKDIINTTTIIDVDF
tara:strand:+ start:4645 stop:5631 length:987 start_codon:yes stop_codon:yes gene_type:complete